MRFDDGYYKEMIVVRNSKAKELAQEKAQKKAGKRATKKMKEIIKTMEDNDAKE